jgi:hypothetical protein
MNNDRSASEPSDVLQDLQFQVMTAADFQSEGKSTHQTTTNSGSITMRLQGIEEWSSEIKTTVVSSIADDMVTTLKIIGRHSEAGILDYTHTERISDVIDIVLNTNERLESCKIRRLRQQNRDQRRAYQHLVRKTEEVLDKYDRKVQGLKAHVRNLRGELLNSKLERELLLRRVHYLEKGGDYGDDGEGDTIVEEKEVESPQDQGMAGLTDEEGEWEEDPETEL